MPDFSDLSAAARRPGRRQALLIALVTLLLAAAASPGVRILAAIAGTAALAVSLAMSNRAARKAQGRIGAVTLALREMANGDLAARAPEPRDSESEELAASANRLAAQVGERIAALERQRTELSSILAAMPEGVLAVRADGVVLQMNPAAGHMLECDPGAVIGRPAVDAPHLELLAQTAASTLRDGLPAMAETPPDASTRRRRFEIRVTPLQSSDARGAPGALAVLRDITELRHLEEVRRDFVSNVSHELKTPVTAIRATIETIIDDPEMTPETRTHFLQRVQIQAMRLSEIVSDLLTLARVEGRSSAAPMDPVDLCEPVRASLAANASAAASRGQELVTILPGREIVVLGDAESLRQVADNLLTNAIRYTPSGGRVAARVFASGRFAVLEIEDTGIGISPDQQARIFERFYRVDKARSRELGGTGLGLAIVRHVVESHGGTVTVESDPGVGSLFRVSLPLQTPP